MNVFFPAVKISDFFSISVCYPVFCAFFFCVYCVSWGGFAVIKGGVRVAGPPGLFLSHLSLLSLLFTISMLTPSMLSPGSNRPMVSTLNHL